MRVVVGGPSPPILQDASPRVVCRCGHLPGAHMRVVPIGSGGSIGGFRLDPSGPCAVCGSPRCAAFSRESGARPVP